MIERAVRYALEKSLQSCVADGIFSIDGLPFEIELSKPKMAEHGDLATNMALMLAKRAGMKPREIADAIVARLPSDSSIIKGSSVAGPGFINIFVDTHCYIEALREITKCGAKFGCVDLGKGKKLQVEFVSANPTGPLHIGHGRGAVYGDALASILSAAGYDVTKEYYVNDSGVQMETLGKSVHFRMRESWGEKIDFPKECYQGAYITDIAREMMAAYGDSLKTTPETDLIAKCGKYAGDKILAEIRADLKETGVEHDIYYFERSLHDEKAVDEMIEFLRGKGLAFDQDGAIWFASMKYGDDKDRVLKKSDGSFTYFATDIAYHKKKYDRGFERIIDIWGADHGGYVARMKAACQALGHDEKSFDAVLIQLVNLMVGGELVSMSTRSATYETLEDVRRDVGRDVCRYFFLMRSHNAQLDFDLDLAKKETPDNPVFYIQYAHARIASIFRKASERGIVLDTKADVDLAPLALPEESAIARKLLEFPEIVRAAAEFLEPHRLSYYLLDLARQFQSYYSQGRNDARYMVVSDDRKSALAKLYLLNNVMVVLQNGLRMLGISAPESMVREEEVDG